jgi:hypothetical protein
MKVLVRAIVGIGLIVAGVILVAAGGSMGGFKKLDVIGWDTVDINEEIEFDELNKVNIEFSVGELNIKRGDSIRLEGNLVKDVFYYDYTDDELNITYSLKNKKLFGGIVNKTFDDLELTIYLPDETYDEFNLSMDVGVLNVKGVSADSSKISLGVGEFNFNDMEIGKLNLKTGVGETNFEGRVTDDSQLDSGIGETNLNITTGKIDFDFNIKNGVGKVNVENKKKSKNNIEKTFEINNGIGEINIKVD